MTEIEYEHICTQMVDPFRQYVKYQQEALQREVFSAKNDEEFLIKKIKYKHLEEILSAFENGQFVVQQNEGDK